MVEKRFHVPGLERMPRPDMRELQNGKLRALVRRCYDSIPFYRGRMDAAGVRPEHIRTVDDLPLLPLVDKSDLRTNYPFPLLSVSRSEIFRSSATSGTTGRPVITSYTRRDWFETLREQMGRVFVAAGVGSGDLLYNSLGYGLWIGGFAFEIGAEAAGAAIFPAGPGRSAAAVDELREIGATVLGSTPSFALYLLDVARARGVDPQQDWQLRVGIVGGEPASAAARGKIEAGMPAGFRFMDLYGTSETGGPNLGYMCLASRERRLLHTMADHYVLEVVDPETGQRREPGQSGELVVTTLSREANPMLRFRTHDLSALASEPYGCSCGRVAHPLFEMVTGRTDDALKVRGTLVFPSAIDDLLLTVPGVGGGWEIRLDKPRDQLDMLTIVLEPDEQTWTQRDGVQRLAARIEEAVWARLRLRPRVQVVEPKSLPRFEGKAKRVVDMRNK